MKAHKETRFVSKRGTRPPSKKNKKIPEPPEIRGCQNHQKPKKYKAPTPPTPSHPLPLPSAPNPAFRILLGPAALHLGAPDLQHQVTLKQLLTSSERAPLVRKKTRRSLFCGEEASDPVTYKYLPTTCTHCKISWSSCSQQLSSPGSW